jgi:glycerol-3-phosphate acyltransferase PlsY
VAVVDVAKGFLPVWLFTRLDDPGAAWAWILAYGGAAILGHMFSVWIGFRGGKGVATSGGVCLALAPWAVLVAFLAWLVTTSVTRWVSLGSIVAAAVLPAAVAVTPHEGGRGVLVFTTTLAVFVIWAHRSNIGRLLRGEERRIGPPGRPGSAREPGGAAVTGPDVRSAEPRPEDA